MKHQNFHPEVCRILDMLENLKDSAQLRANELFSIYKRETRHEAEVRRAKAQSAADAYSFCQMLLRSADIY